MTQPEIDAYVTANNLTPIDPADGGIENTFKSAPVTESSPNGNISVVTLYGFNVGDYPMQIQKYRDAPQNFEQCMRMLKEKLTADLEQDADPEI